MSTSSSSTTSSVLATSAGLLPTPAFNHLINIKLNRTNYLLWKAQILPYLRGQQLLGYVDGSIVCPAETITQATDAGATQVPNPAYQQWIQQDQMVMSVLLSSLSEEVLSQVLFLPTSAQVWQALGQMFSSSSKARVMQIRMLLSTTKKGDLSMADYFNKMKNLGDTLSAIGQPLREEELGSYMLAGLDSDYDALVTSITTRNDAISLNDLYAHMLSYEMRKEQQQGTFQISANNVQRSRGGGRNVQRGRGRGSRGKQVAGSVSGSPHNGSRPMCQVCGKIGHVALKCYHRFDHSY